MLDHKFHIVSKQKHTTEKNIVSYIIYNISFFQNFESLSTAFLKINQSIFNYSRDSKLSNFQPKNN